MTQMTTTKRILLFLWLVLLGVAHAPAVVLHASENRIWKISNDGYDEAGTASTGYDGSEKPSSAYDVALSRVREDSERRFAWRRTSFASFGRLLAVKGATTPISRTVTGVADDALVHFGPEGYSVIKPGAGGQVFSFRYGDIKHLTPKQIEAVIGDLSRSGQPGGSSFMHVLDATAAGATKTPGAVVSEIPEFIFDAPVPVNGVFSVQ